MNIAIYIYLGLATAGTAVALVTKNWVAACWAASGFLCELRHL